MKVDFQSAGFTFWFWIVLICLLIGRVSCEEKSTTYYPPETDYEYHGVYGN